MAIQYWNTQQFDTCHELYFMICIVFYWMHLLVDILNVHNSLLHDYGQSESHTLLMDKNKFKSYFPCLPSNLAKIQFKGFWTYAVEHLWVS